MNIALPPAVRAGLLAAGMLGFLLAMAGLQIYQRSAGTEVTLQAYPVDPRSLFRGYYVILDTDISSLDTGELAGADDFAVGDAVFVAIEESPDGIWLPTALAKSRDAAGAGVAVKGRVVRVYEPYRDADDPAGGAIVEAVYNLESYFAEEGAAKELEVSVRSGELRLIASVSPSGTAVVKGLEIDGVRYLDRLF